MHLRLPHTHRATAFLLAACLGWHFSPLAVAGHADPLSDARRVFVEVNQKAAQLSSSRFRTRLAGVEYISEVVAHSEDGHVRKLAVADRDDSGDVLTDFYFGPDGELVFALRTTMGYTATGQQKTSNEQRLYFQHGRLVHWLGGLDKKPVPTTDAAARAEEQAVTGMARVLRALAVAPPAPMVKVGAASKLSQGKLTALEPGDTACHLELMDIAGRVYQELANFAFCEQPKRLLGQTVSLTYTIGTVMSAKCQGDTQCKWSDRVALVSAINPISGKQGGRGTPSVGQ